MEEHPEIKIVDRWIIRLGKDDAEWDPWYLPGETFADDYEGFLACLHLKRIAIRSEARLKEQKQGVRSAKKAAKDAAKELAKAREKAEKAAAKAEARIAKEEEVKRIKAEAKVAREALRAEAKQAKATAKKAPKPVAVPLPEAIANAEADNRIAGLPSPEILVLSPKDAEVFVEAILNPPAPNEALKEARTRFIDAVEELIQPINIPMEGQ